MTSTQKTSKKATESSSKAPSKTPKTPKKTSSKKPLKWYGVAFYALFIMSWIAASMLASQILVGNILLLIFGSEAMSGTVLTAVYSILSYLLMFVLIMFVPYRFLKKKRLMGELPSLKSILGIRGLPTWTDIGLAIVGFVVSLILAMVLVFIFSLFPWFDVSQDQNVGFNIYSVGAERLVAFISLIIIAPIAEELIFRGWMYGRLRNITSKTMTSLASAIVSSLLVSLLFGIMHFQWNVGVNVFAMSLVLCGLREATGTIYAGIIMHMIKNCLAFYYLFVVGI